MCLSAILGAGASLIGGLAQGSAASKAAKAQQQSADQQIALQKQIYDEQTKNYAPYLSAGNNALAAYNSLLGLGPTPTFGGTAPQITEVPGAATTGAPANGYARPPFIGGGRSNVDTFNVGSSAMPPQAAPSTFRVGDQTFATRAEAEAYANAHKTGGQAYGGFQESPGYKFALQQGLDSVNALAGAKGGLNSGKTMQDLLAYGQGMASQEYNNYLGQIYGLVNVGTGAAGNQANAGANYAANAGNALSSKGNAASAGAIGVGNAFNNTANNLIGQWQYQQMLGSKPGGMGTASDLYASKNWLGGF